MINKIAASMAEALAGVQDGATVLIGGVGPGTVLTLLFLPALYALWFKVKQPDANEHHEASPALVT